jgi:hypothetical protein
MSQKMMVKLASLPPEPNTQAQHITLTSGSIDSESKRLKMVIGALVR